MARLKPRSTTVVIYQGDDMDVLADLKRKVDYAERIATEGDAAPARKGDVRPSVKLARDRYDAFVDEAAERALEVKVHAIGRRRFLDLTLENPPRKVDQTDAEGNVTQVVHEDDAIYQVNTLTFPLKLLKYRDGDVRTIAEPEFSTAADLELFLDDEISAGDFEQLWTNAYFLNRGMSGDPLASRYSLSTSET